MNWLTRLMRRERLEAQLDAELRDHFERLVLDYVRDGLSERRRAPAGATGIRWLRSGQRALPRCPWHALVRRAHAGSFATAGAASIATAASPS